jgi:uncharacterized protein UPF0164
MGYIRSFRWVLAMPLLGCLLPGVSQAQTGEKRDNTGYGTTAGEFVLLGAGARGTALGSAFSSIADDASALYYNPAGTAALARPEFSIGTYDYVAETRYTWGGIVFPFSEGARAIGLQVGTFGFSDQKIYTVEDPEGVSTGTYSVSETFVGLTLAQNFSDRFSAGVTAKGIFDNLGEATGQAFAVDFGANFHASLSGHPIRLGFTLQNLGTNLTYSGDALNVDVPRDNTGGQTTLPQQGQLRTKGFNLPTLFRVGLAYDIMGGESSRLTVLSDFNQMSSNRAGFSAGGEWALNKLGGSDFGVALRGSYTYAPANNFDLTNPLSDTALNDEENLQGLGLGGGINYRRSNFNLGLDYAYKYMGVLGATNFFSFTLGW